MAAETLAATVACHRYTTHFYSVWLPPFSFHIFYDMERQRRWSHRIKSRCISVTSDYAHPDLLAAKHLSGEWRTTSLMRNQYWSRWWLGGVRQQAITRANVDPYLRKDQKRTILFQVGYGTTKNLSCHIAPLGHKELIPDGTYSFTASSSSGPVFYLISRSVDAQNLFLEFFKRSWHNYWWLAC